MNTFAYVNSYEQARNYQIMPNSNVILIDTDKPYIYMKTTNQMGQATIKCYEIREIPDEVVNPKPLDRSDFEALMKRIGELEAKYESANARTE